MDRHFNKENKMGLVSPIGKCGKAKPDKRKCEKLKKKLKCEDHKEYCSCKGVKK